MGDLNLNKQSFFVEVEQYYMLHITAHGKTVKNCSFPGSNYGSKSFIYKQLWVLKRIKLHVFPCAVMCNQLYCSTAQRKYVLG